MMTCLDPKKERIVINKNYDICYNESALDKMTRDPMDRGMIQKIDATVLVERFLLNMRTKSERIKKAKTPK